jgi:hypothetical protein
VSPQAREDRRRFCWQTKVDKNGNLWYRFVLGRIGRFSVEQEDAPVAGDGDRKEFFI